MTAVTAEGEGAAFPAVRLLLLSAGLFVVGTNAFIITSVMPAVAVAYRTTIGAVSTSITVYALLFAVAAPVISTVGRRIPRAVLMGGGLAVLALGSACAMTVPSLTGFVAGRALAAVGAAAFVPTATATAVAIAAPSHRGRAMALVTAGFSGATALGAPVGTLLAGLGGWRATLLFVVVLALLVAAGVAALLRGLPPAPAGSLRGRLAVLGRPRLLAGLAGTAALVAGTYSAYTFSAVVLAPTTDGDPARLALLLALYGAGSIGGNALGGQLIDRVGPTLVGHLAFAGLIAVFVAMPWATRGIGTGIAAVVLWGVMGSCTALALQYRILATAPEAAAVVLAWNTSATYLGVALSSPLAVAAIALVGAPSLTLVSLPVVAVAWGAWALARARRDRAIPGRGSGI